MMVSLVFRLICIISFSKLTSLFCPFQILMFEWRVFFSSTSHFSITSLGFWWRKTHSIPWAILTMLPISISIVGKSLLLPIFWTQRPLQISLVTFMSCLSWLVAISCNLLCFARGDHRLLLSLEIIRWILCRILGLLWTVVIAMTWFLLFFFLLLLQLFQRFINFYPKSPHSDLNAS